MELIPDFLGYDADGRRVNASDFAGQPLIVYFYPKDNTPGCTAEACSLRDSEAQLAALGYTVIGVSRDSAASHARFAQKYSLPFLLLSDPEAEAQKAFGVWRLKRMCGRESMGTVRTTFVTDAAHRITHVIEKVDTKHAGDQLLALLAQQQQ